MVDGALLAQKMNDLDGVAALPKKVTEVIVCANFFADGFAKFDQRAGIVDDEVGMHFESEAPDAVVARIFRSILPVRNHFFFPLPVLHLGVFWRPAVSDPVGLRVLRRAAWAAGKTDDYFDIEHFSEKDSFAEGVDVLFCEGGVGMKRVAMTTEGGDAKAAIFEFFMLGLGFGAVGNEVIDRKSVV